MTPSSFDSLALSKSVQTDAQLRAYLIKTGRSVNAVSFDDVVSISAAIAARRRQPSLAIAPESVGTLDAYRRFRDLVAEAAAQVDKDRPWFHPDAASMVCRALIEARLKGSRVRLFYGDTSTGVDAIEVSHTVGWIGRGGQPFPAPVLLATPQARHGIPLREQCIVRIQSVDDRYDLYRHPHYRLPSFTRVDAVDGSVRVVVEGGAVIDFPDELTWNRWEQFALGRVFVPPRHPTEVPDTSPVRAAALEYVDG